MPNKTIYLNENSLRIAEDSGEGVGPYINRLIEEDGGGVEIKPKTVKKGVPASAQNPRICSRCGHVKVAGKCINC